VAGVYLIIGDKGFEKIIRDNAKQLFLALEDANKIIGSNFDLEEAKKKLSEGLGLDL